MGHGDGASIRLLGGGQLQRLARGFDGSCIWAFMVR